MIASNLILVYVVAQYKNVLYDTNRYLGHLFSEMHNEEDAFNAFTIGLAWCSSWCANVGFGLATSMFGDPP